MPEELRVFVRAGLYVAAATVVYWLVADEVAGTLMLGFLFVAAVVFVVLGRAIGRAPSGRQSFVALDEEGGEEAPLEIEEEPVVTVNAAPLLGAAAGWREKRHRPASRLERVDAERAERRARALIDDAAFEAAHRTGMQEPHAVVRDLENAGRR